MSDAKLNTIAKNAAQRLSGVKSPSAEDVAAALRIDCHLNGVDFTSLSEMETGKLRMYVLTELTA